MVRFFESIFPFSQINFQGYFRKLSFCWSFTEYSGMFTFLNTRNAILMTTSSVFITSDYVITIWYSYLHVLMSEIIQSKSALSQRCSALKQRWIFQFWTALTQRKPELISSETELISADVFHVLWSSAEKR